MMDHEGAARGSCEDHQAAAQVAEDVAETVAQDKRRSLASFTDNEIRTEYRKRFFAMKDRKRPKDEPGRRAYMREYMRTYRDK
jgi:hypothetical protein